jgi:PhnB protein
MRTPDGDADTVSSPHRVGDRAAVGGDVGYAPGLARMGSAGAFSMWFRITLGLRETEGRWQIIRLHEPGPFNMDQSFKAPIDLRP